MGTNIEKVNKYLWFFKKYIIFESCDEFQVNKFKERYNSCFSKSVRTEAKLYSETDNQMIIKNIKKYLKCAKCLEMFWYTTCHHGNYDISWLKEKSMWHRRIEN